MSSVAVFPATVVEACAQYAPVSTPWPIRMMETPVSASPARIARWMGAAPRQRGRSEACTFTHPAGAIASTSSGRMQP